VRAEAMRVHPATEDERTGPRGGEGLAWSAPHGMIPRSQVAIGA
ncbi:MAG: hypothetical protein H6Q34_398, partial [Deltaproteobacteria bacterium]|nr:hypothetical protein [Deltaproteobacteria bacterium]